jgi:hypothetical protein
VPTSNLKTTLLQTYDLFLLLFAPSVAVLQAQAYSFGRWSTGSAVRCNNILVSKHEDTFFDSTSSGSDCAATCEANTSYHCIIAADCVLDSVLVEVAAKIRRGNTWNIVKYMSCLLLIFSSALHTAARVWDVGSTYFGCVQPYVKTTYCFY